MIATIPGVVAIGREYQHGQSWNSRRKIMYNLEFRYEEIQEEKSKLNQLC